MPTSRPPSTSSQGPNPDTSSHYNLYCEGCGGCDFYRNDDDGHYYCSQCGSQSQDLIHTATADEDLLADGALYNISYARSYSQSQNPSPLSKAQLSQQLSQKLEQARALHAHANDSDPVKFAGFDDDELSEPRDFGSGSCSDKEAVADGLRLRYVEGLQVMVQGQCEALVERFGVSPYVVGIVGPIWLRYVAAMQVLADDWPDKVIQESDVAADAAGLVRLGERDYSKDMSSYLKYCKDVLYAGITKSYEEEKLIERLWDMYEKQEDDNAGEAKRPRTGVSNDDSLDPMKRKEDDKGRAMPMEEDFAGGNLLKEPLTLPNSRTVIINAAIEKIKLEMEANGFEYLTPQVHRKIGYVHYRRQRVDGKLVCVAPADYYLVLRACAKLAEVDAQTMHRCVLSFERRLEWIDKQIDKLFCHEDGES